MAVNYLHYGDILRNKKSGAESRRLIIFCTDTVAVRLYGLNVNSQLPSSRGSLVSAHFQDCDKVGADLRVTVTSRYINIRRHHSFIRWPTDCR